MFLLLKQEHYQYVKIERYWKFFVLFCLKLLELSVSLYGNDYLFVYLISLWIFLDLSLADIESSGGCRT